MDVIYTWPTWPLLTTLLVLTFVANEVGFRIGRKHHRGEPESSRSVSGRLEASVLGLVALLLGFAFSGTAGRHELRRKMVLDEANAIGTCYWRAGLLEDSARARIREALRRFVSVRLEFFEKALDPDDFRRTSDEMDRLMGELWAAVEKANRKDRQAVLTSQIVPAANEVIELNGTRSWMVRNHLPPPVLLLLAVGILTSSLLVGHSCGQTGRRNAWLWVAFNVLFALVLFVILDFDRPRRGLIQVDHAPLIELKSKLDRATDP